MAGRELGLATPVGLQGQLVIGRGWGASAIIFIGFAMWQGSEKNSREVLLSPDYQREGGRGPWHGQRLHLG